MNIHEYQAKQLLRGGGVPIQKGHMVESVAAACAWGKSHPAPVWAVKAQIHAGGRGKGGGVKLARSVDELQQYAQNILGMQLVTPQTGPKGQQVRKLLIEQGCDIKKEYYVSLLVNRKNSCLSFVASCEGGMSIEEVAAATPEKIHRIDVPPEAGARGSLPPFLARELAFKLAWRGRTALKAAQVFQRLYAVFYQYDCSLLEINPLVETKDGNIVALDAKMAFDSNALYRHPDVVELRDLNEEDPAEVEASRHDLALIKLDGPIGCMVNGAGLAMATMDIIKLNGASPANFLDVGGGASKEKVTAAFKIITQDPNVKVILVNIFGGIMKCDVIAAGIIAATKEVGLKHPLVVRLEGTRVQEGKKLLADSGLQIELASNLHEAAQKAVAVAGANKAT